MHCCSYCSSKTIVLLLVCFNLRNVPEGAEPEIISTIKKTFNFGQSEAVHLFQTLLECMKKKELVSRFCHNIFLCKVHAFVDMIEFLFLFFWIFQLCLLIKLYYHSMLKAKPLYRGYV